MSYLTTYIPPKCPVIALEVFSNYLFVGQGCFLKIYSISENSFLTESEILHYSVIHGITFKRDSTGQEDNTVLSAYGEKKFVIANFDRGAKKVTTCSEAILEDWIYHLEFLNEQDLVCVILGHCQVLVFDCVRNQSLVRVQSKDSCTLYCGKLFFGNEWPNVLCAVGTVFQEVLIWSPGRSNEVLHRFHQHDVDNGESLGDTKIAQGAIFNIDIDVEHQILVSSSDDRSLQIWQWVIPEDEPSPNDCSKWQVKSAARLYGHEARIWKARIVYPYVVSVGEDGRCNLWDYSGTLVDRFDLRKIGSIRAVVVNMTEKGPQIFMGSDDGGIRIWYPRTKRETQHSTFDVLINYKTDFVRAMCLIDHNTAFCVSHEGRLLVGSTTALEEDGFLPIGIVRCSPCRQFLCVPSEDGRIRIYDSKSLIFREYNTKSSLILSVTWLDSIGVLVSVDGARAILWYLDGTLDPDASFRIPKGRHPWLTYAALCGSWLVCGDANGSIFTYWQQRKQAEGLIEWKQLFPSIHGKNGVTSLAPCGACLYSTGRDGKLRKFSVDEEQGLQMISETKPLSDCEWLERILHYNDEMLISGFQSSKFVLFNVDRNQTLVAVDCGGGHRSHDFIIHEGYFYFAYVNKRKTHRYVTRLPRLLRELEPGLHPSSINCVELAEQDDVDLYMVTGGENTEIQFSAVETGKFKPLVSIQGHLSSVKCLAVLSHDKESLLVASAGGRSELSVWRIQMKPELQWKRVANHLLGTPFQSKEEKEPVDDIRYMSMCFHADTGTLIVAGSDGFIRSYSLQGNKLIPVKTCKSHRFCILYVAVAHSNWILSADTAGYICWTPLSMLLPETSQDAFMGDIIRFRVHSAGANAVDFRSLTETEVEVGSSGEDCSIALSRFTILGKEISLKYKRVHPSCHASQVIGLRFIGGNHIITASKDQRIYLWKVNDDEISVVDYTRTSVADVTSLAISRLRNLIVITGRGAEAFSLNYVMRDEL